MYLASNIAGTYLLEAVNQLLEDTTFQLKTDRMKKPTAAERMDTAQYGKCFIYGERVAETFQTMYKGWDEHTGWKRALHWPVSPLEVLQCIY